MRRLYVFTFCFLLVLPVGSLAQSFEIPAVGTDETFNVATWNIEHFGNPSDGPNNTALQFQNVLGVMQQANVHLWAVQEIYSPESFENLVAELGESWAGFRQDDMTSFNVGYGFIYRTDIVEPLNIAPVLVSSAYEFGFRPPLLMRANITLPSGATIDGIRIITMHAKCCGTFTDWERRRDASEALKSFVDNLVAANFPTIILGDLNDRLRVSISGNRPSPYTNFRTDENRYFFSTLALEDAGVYSYCSNNPCTNGTMLDHILLTTPILEHYEESSTARYDALLTNIPNYRSTTSDHLPITARFDIKTSSTEGPSRPIVFGLEAPYPNPFLETVTIVYSLETSSNVRLEVFDLLGRRVQTVTQSTQSAGRYETTVNGADLAPGMYIVRLTTDDGRSSARRIVRVQ